MAAIAAALTVFFAAPHALADVVEVAPHGFVVRTELGVEARPDAVWKALLDVGGWWNMDHSYSRDSANITIDARPGGCFCEKLPNGGGVAHAMVVFNVVMTEQVTRLKTFIETGKPVAAPK